VLASGPDEWVGVDMETGVYVRSRITSSGSDDVGDEWSLFDLATLQVAVDDEPPDPARPEAVAMVGPPEHSGRLRPRAARRLLKRLTAPEQRWVPLLGTRGPSVAYIDLDLASSSLVLIATSAKKLKCSTKNDQAYASFTWGGTTQALPIEDPSARRAVMSSSVQPIEPAALAAAIGGKPGYLLLGLGAVRQGHAPKVVLSIAPKRPRRRSMRRSAGTTDVDRAELDTPTHDLQAATSTAADAEGTDRALE
jgi:hypothetical protein